MQPNQIISKIEEKFHCKLSHLYLYGSRVYNTHTPESDFDFIGVGSIGQDYLECHHDLELGFDITLYSPAEFQRQIDIHEISALECLHLPLDQILLNGNEWHFKLNLHRLRESISKKSSHAWVKSKKKLADGEILLAQKSLFHCFRIIGYGIQIARYNDIVDYESQSYLLKEIQALEPNWNVWQDKYKQQYNNAMTQFRLLAPKV